MVKFEMKYVKSAAIMLIMYALGIMLYYRSLIIQKNLDENKTCESLPLLRAANHGIAFLGIFLIVAPTTLFINALTCGCVIFDKIASLTSCIFMLFLGMVIIALGSILRAGSNDTCSDIEPSDIIWITGLVIVVVSVIFYIFLMRDKSVSKNTQFKKTENADVKLQAANAHFQEAKNKHEQARHRAEAAIQIAAEAKEAAENVEIIRQKVVEAKQELDNVIQARAASYKEKKQARRELDDAANKLDEMRKKESERRQKEEKKQQSDNKAKKQLEKQQNSVRLTEINRQKDEARALEKITQRVISEKTKLEQQKRDDEAQKQIIQEQLIAKQAALRNHQYDSELKDLTDENRNANIAGKKAAKPESTPVWTSSKNNVLKTSQAATNTEYQKKSDDKLASERDEQKKVFFPESENANNNDNQETQEAVTNRKKSPLATQNTNDSVITNPNDVQITIKETPPKDTKKARELLQHSKTSNQRPIPGFRDLMQTVSQSRNAATSATTAQLRPSQCVGTGCVNHQREYNNTLENATTKVIDSNKSLPTNNHNTKTQEITSNSTEDSSKLRNTSNKLPQIDCRGDQHCISVQQSQSLYP